MRYAVGIPTRGRNEVLLETLGAFQGQTRPPGLVIVVDNNVSLGGYRGDDGVRPARIAINKADPDLPILVVAGRGKLSDASGSQQALEVMTKMGHRVGVKWDDDLVPEPDCMEKLLGVFSEYPDGINRGRITAVGGTYPREGDERLSRLVDWVPTGGDGNRKHLQLFLWGGEGLAEELVVNHLYSSFAYDVESVNLIGGFCTEYSPHSYRHETDLTLRLGRLGDLVVATDAVAVHRVAPGGVRRWDDEERVEMMARDQELFERRMRSMGLWRTWLEF
jgi:GT2 family glycosyltransferase